MVEGRRVEGMAEVLGDSEDSRVSGTPIFDYSQRYVKDGEGPDVPSWRVEWGSIQ